MKYDIKVPAVGESITEAMVSSWLKKSGEYVKTNDVLLSLETDKASVEVVAEQSGVLTVIVPEKQVIPIGAVVGSIDSEGKPEVVTASAAASSPSLSSAVSPALSPAVSPALSPAVRRIVAETNLDVTSVEGSGRGGRVTKGDALAALEKNSSSNAPTSKSIPIPASSSSASGSPERTYPKADSSPTGQSRRVPMSMLRRKIAERLVEAQSTAAILTTFNEIDMTNTMALRSKYKDAFKEKYGVNLGFMSFFVKACVEALKKFPEANATIDGTDIVYKDFYNVGVAVGTERGLIVPVIRNADGLSMAGVESSIRDYAMKARDGKIAIEDLSGGTFTISNGGTYGSLMSTPILNFPQSGILGMHKIEERAVVIAGKIEIRPMMYVAFSYDHRIIDGSQSVGFLVKVKECIEDPTRILLSI